MGRYSIKRRRGPHKGQWSLTEQEFKQWQSENKIDPMDEIHDSESGQTQYAKNMGILAAGSPGVATQQEYDGMEFKGNNGTMVLTDTSVIIKRGMKGFLLGGMMLKGDKSIPYHSITSVQLKKAGLMSGYIQLGIKGGSESKAGLLKAQNDENSVSFSRASKNGEFAEAKRIIEERISHSAVSSPQPIPQTNDIDDIERIAELHKKGILTDEEFTEKKKQLLGI